MTLSFFFNAFGETSKCNSLVGLSLRAPYQGSARQRCSEAKVFHQLLNICFVPSLLGHSGGPCPLVDLRLISCNALPGCWDSRQAQHYGGKVCCLLGLLSCLALGRKEGKSGNGELGSGSDAGEVLPGCLPSRCLGALQLKLNQTNPRPWLQIRNEI